MTAGLYCFGGFIPPVFGQGLSESSSLGSSLYRYFCHQLPERSFVCNGYQLAFCARCTGFFIGLFISSLFLIGFRILQSLPLHWLLILSIPMIVDVVFDLSSMTPFPNVLRLITGFVCSTAACGFVLPRMLQLILIEPVAATPGKA